MPAPNAGLAGAELAIADNNTTGRFLNQKFSITDVKLGQDEDPAAAVQKLAGEGISLVVTDLPAAALLKAADAGPSAGMLFFNAGALSDACARRIAAPMSFTSRPRARCWPMGSPNISSGSNG